MNVSYQRLKRDDTDEKRDNKRDFTTKFRKNQDLRAIVPLIMNILD